MPRPDKVSDVTQNRDDDIDYLQRIESLAKEVVDRAASEGWLTYQPDPQTATPLQRSVNELARHLRHVHHEGDGCLDH